MGGFDSWSRSEARGSLLAAAREIGRSYRHAWRYLRCVEQALGSPLVRARPGKGRRRGTGLTAEGHRLLSMLSDARDRLDWGTGGTGPTREESAARGRRQATRRPRTGGDA